jgi:hypothetical protein
MPSPGPEGLAKLAALGIEYADVSHNNLISAQLPVGWLRKCGPNNEWLFPTVLVGPDGTNIIVEYEDRETVIVPPRASEPAL